MATVSSGALLVLLGVFLLAAVSKVRAPGSSARATNALGAPRWAAPFVVPAELIVVLMLVGFPPVGAASAIAMLSAFTVLLLRVVRSGRVVSCGCFGVASKSPVTTTTIARNVGLVGVSGLAAAARPLFRTPASDLLPAVLVGVGVVAIGLLLAALIDVRRSTGFVFSFTRMEV